MIESRERDLNVVREVLKANGVAEDISGLDAAKYGKELCLSLIGVLKRIQDPMVRLYVLKALTSKKIADQTEPILIDEFKSETVHGPGVDSFKWGVGNCLEIIADKKSKYVSEYLKIAVDRKYGTSRQMIVLALAKLDGEAVDDVLIGLLDDPDVFGRAIMALGRRRTKSAYHLIARYQSDSATWVKRESKKALALIEKAHSDL